mgnify:CR=1 FL=1
MKLKITDNSFGTSISEIEPTELFVISQSMNQGYDVTQLFGGVFMKLEEDNHTNKNAVRLNDGELFHINDSMVLQCISGELII